MNVNAEKINSQFEELLKNFEFKKEYTSSLKVALMDELKTRFAAALNEKVYLNKRISELQSQAEKVEERFVLDELSQSLYLKHSGKFKQQIESLQHQLSKNSFSSSNLKKPVQKGLNIAHNISRQWAFLILIRNANCNIWCFLKESVMIKKMTRF